MAEKFSRWDSAEYLKTDEDIAEYLEAALEEDDPAFFAHALGVVARARGMTQVAKDAGVTREGLYKALSHDGNAEFSTIYKVARALGLRFHVGTSASAGAVRCSPRFTSSAPSRHKP